MYKRQRNNSLAFDFALTASLSEAAREPNQSSSDLCDSAGSYIRAGSAMFFAETEGELTLGSPAAFAAGSVWRGFRAKQSNTPSVSRQKQAADTSDVTTSRIARNQRFRLPGRLTEGAFKGKVKRKAKSLFTAFPIRRKSAFRSASC
mgnify:CR=1 FL=1